MGRSLYDRHGQWNASDLLTDTEWFNTRFFPLLNIECYSLHSVPLSVQFNELFLIMPDACKPKILLQKHSKKLHVFSEGHSQDASHIHRSRFFQAFFRHFFQTSVSVVEVFDVHVSFQELSYHQISSRTIKKSLFHIQDTLWSYSDHQQCVWRMTHASNHWSSNEQKAWWRAAVVLVQDLAGHSPCLWSLSL